MWIYVIRNIVTNKLYVGQTERTDPHERWREHVECVKGRRRQRLYSSMRHHGVERFEFTPWECCATIEDLDDAEQFWIAFFRSWDENFGYNKTMGGQRGRLTPDRRQRLSELNTGVLNPFHGKHHSESAKKAIGEAQIGNKHGLGKKASQEKLEKQRQAMLRVWSDPSYKERLCEKHRAIQRFVPRSKLNEDDVENVVRRLAQGEFAKDIALSLSVSPSMITRIKQGRYRALSSNRV